MFGDQEVSDKGEEFLGGPIEVEDGGVEFGGMVVDGAGGEEGFFLLVEDSVPIVSEDFDKLVSFVRVPVEAAVSLLCFQTFKHLFMAKS